VARALVLVVAVIVTLTALAWLFQRRLIYFPDDGPVPSAGSVIAGAEDVTLHTGDGLELDAWFVPADKPDRGVVVLVAHGNAGDRAGRAPLAAALAERGLGVLLFDYRGYGGNPGSPSEAGLALDARAAYEHLVTDRGVQPARLIVFGESLGAGVVTELATEHPTAGVVLRSPFVDLAAVGRAHYPFLPVRQLLRDDFPVADQVADLEAPVVVVYGAADSIVPPDQSRAVAGSAGNLRNVVEIPGADHNDAVLVHGGPVVDAVVDLADHVSQAR
jgi:fermentation-respiration switch protein FrsA (DUF1100 family)